MAWEEFVVTMNEIVLGTILKRIDISYYHLCRRE